MAKNMYDEKGILKPEFELTDSERRKMLYNNKINPRTDYGKGIFYLTCDGKVCATMEEVMQYNQMYYDSNNKIDDHTIENKGMHR